MARKPKIQIITCNLSEAFSAGYDELEMLRDEMSEWRDNMEEKLSHTDKYERVSEAADYLDSAVENKPDEEDLPDVQVSYTIEIGRSPRWLRRDNAVAALNAVISGLEALSEESEEDEEKDFGDIISDITDSISEAENVDFPGMFG